MKKFLIYFLIFCFSIISVNAQKVIEIDSLKQSNKDNLFPYNSVPIYVLNGSPISFENLKNISAKDIKSVTLIKEEGGVSHGPTLKQPSMLILTKRKRYYRKLFSIEIPPKN